MLNYLMKFYDVCGNDDTCDGNQDVEDILDEDEYLEINENLVAQEHRDVEKVGRSDYRGHIGCNPPRPCASGRVEVVVSSGILRILDFQFSILKY